jgi:hypothetical protein
MIFWLIKVGGEGSSRLPLRDVDATTSVGSVADPYGNAMAEPLSGPFKAEHYRSLVKAPPGRPVAALGVRDRPSGVPNGDFR